MQNANTGYMPQSGIPQPPQPTLPPAPVNEQDEQAFYAMVSKQVTAEVDIFEERLNSVHKERESVIGRIQTIVQQLFEQKAVSPKQSK